MERLVTKHFSTDQRTVKHWTCIATGCRHGGSNQPAMSRVLKHAVKCEHLKIEHRDVFDEAFQHSSGLSLSAQLSADSLSVSAQPASLEDSRLPRNKSQQQLDIQSLRQVGDKKKKEGDELFKKRVDKVIMQLICRRGLVPSILDSDDWKDFVTTLSGSRYQGTSSSTFADLYIPAESIHIDLEQTRLLKNDKHLTLTFDGTTSRRPQSFYTVHATTSTRQSFLLGAYEGSGQRHTKEWIVERLLQVRFKALSCSNINTPLRLSILLVLRSGRQSAPTIRTLQRLHALKFRPTYQRLYLYGTAFTTSKTQSRILRNLAHSKRSVRVYIKSLHINTELLYADGLSHEGNHQALQQIELLRREATRRIF